MPITLQQMKKIIVLLCISLFVQISFAQDVDETKNYVYLFNGSVEYGNIVEQKMGLFQGAKIRADNKEWSPKEVRFYKSERGFYANIGPAKGKTSRTFAQRERTGNINLYRLVQTYYTGAGYTSGGGMGGRSGRSVTYYYNKGFGDVKKANYKNLSVDLVDNKKSLLHLSNYKRAYNMQSGCLFGVFASVVGGQVIMSIAEKNKRPGEKLNYAPLFVGFGSAIVFAVATAVFASKKHKHLKAAIDAYNE
jgi:hypothetical protein